MTDRELLDRYNQNDARDAMCELMRRYIGMVYATALREVREPHLADDVTQAVFIVLMRRARALPPDVVLGGWLFQVTRYAIADLKKKQARRERHEREAGIMRLEQSQTADAPWADIEPHLNLAIGKLAATDRDVVVMRYLEGKPISHIATVMGASDNTTRQRLSRALQRLRKQLVKKGLPIAVATLAGGLEQTSARAAPPPLVQSVSGIISHGLVPSGSTMSLVAGVLKIMRTAKFIFATSVTAAVGCVLFLGYLAAAAAMSGDKPATNTASSTTVPAIEAGPRDTPKGTVVTAFHACVAGDEEGLLRCFDALTAEQTHTLRLASQSFKAMDDLQKAVGDKFGPEARQQFASRSLGVDPNDVEKSTESINGTSASVDVGKSGPGKVALVKAGDVWKISATTLATLSPEVVAQTAAKIPAINTITENVKAGKYASVGDLQNDLMSASSRQP